MVASSTLFSGVCKFTLVFVNSRLASSSVGRSGKLLVSLLVVR